MRSIIVAFVATFAACCCTTQSAESEPVNQLLLMPPAFIKPSNVNVDTDKGVALIQFDDDVEASAITKLIEAITKADGDKDVKQIVIEMDTDGGSVEEGQRLSRVIERAKKPITCVVDGEADSMGFYILQSCPKRMMTSRSILMVHEPLIREGQSGNQHTFGYYSDMLKALNSGMVDHMAKRMKMTKEQLAEKISVKAWWMAAPEALQVGAVDDVVTSVEDVIKAFQK